MIRTSLCILLVVSVLFFTGCAAHVHKVGAGPQGPYDVTRARQWYILYGFVPLNHINSQDMAAGAKNYRIITYAGPIDVLWSAVLAPVTISSRSVIVEK